MGLDGLHIIIIIIVTPVGNKYSLNYYCY